MKMIRNFYLIIVIFSLSSCASPISVNDPAINSSYIGKLEVSALKVSGNMTNVKDNDYLWNFKLDNFQQNFGTAADNSKSTSTSGSNEWTTRGVNSIYYGNNGVFMYKCIRNGSYRVTSNRFCTVNTTGDGQIVKDNLSESGTIVLVCGGDIYNGSYIIQGKLQTKPN